MTGPDTVTMTNWDHSVGVTTMQLPQVDALLFVAASIRPGSPIVVDLTGEEPSRISTDRDRAVLRAFLTLALARLDEQEDDDR